MLPSRPRIQPVKGGVGRDSISSGWGNGFLSEMHLPVESGTFLYQNTVSENMETGVRTTFYDIFGKVDSENGPNTYFACGHVYNGEEPWVPQLDKLVCDSFYSYLVTDEILSTTDFQQFQSVHGECGYSTGDWLREPEPVVTVNGEVKSSSTDYLIDYTNGRVNFMEKIKRNSTLSAGVNSGEITLYVVDEEGFESGDLVVIEGDNSDENEVRTVSSVSAGQVVVTEALDYSHSSGKTVIENDPVVKVTYRYIEQHLSEYELFSKYSNEGPPLLPAGFHEYSERRDEGSGILRLKNPIFANWDNGYPDGWTLGGAGVGTITQASGIIGESCLQIETTPDTDWVYFSQIFSGSSSGKVTFSCWVKTDSQAMIEIIPTGYASVSTVIQCDSTEMLPFADKWVRVTVVAPNGVSPVEVRLYGQRNSTDGGVTMFDGAMLIQH